MKLDIVKLDRELREQKIRSLYVIVGAEHHLMLSAQKKIEKAIIGNDNHELGRTVFEGRTFNMSSFVDSLQALPMFGSRNLVLVREADRLVKDKLDDVLVCLEKNSGSSTAVFMASKLDGRSRFMQAVSKSTTAALIECKPLYANQLPSWISMEMRREGKQIALDAANYLADIIGSDLGQLSQAMERISLFVGQKRMVELADVEEAVAETTQRSVFEFTDALGNKDKKRARLILKNLVDNGAQPIMILSMVARHFRILIKAKEVEKWGADRETASYLGVNSFFVKNYVNQARNFTLDELKIKFKLLSQCDRQIKSSRLPKERILEHLII